MKAVVAMYEGAQTVARTTEGASKAFNVKIRLHQGSVLSPPLFMIAKARRAQRKINVPVKTSTSNNLHM